MSAAITREVATRSSGQLRIEPYCTDGSLLGVDLGADLTQPHLSALLCDIAFFLARTYGLETFDPQLGRAVHPGDTELIQRQHHLGSSFCQAVPLSSSTVVTGSAASLRLWLIIGAACLGALVLARALSCAL